MSPACGQMAVTPVRQATPSTSRFTVTWPTRTPGTSVMALSGPGGSRPGLTPKSRMRGMGILLAVERGQEALGAGAEQRGQADVQVQRPQLQVAAHRGRGGQHPGGAA